VAVPPDAPDELEAVVDDDDDAGADADELALELEPELPQAATASAIATATAVHSGLLYFLMRPPPRGLSAGKSR
jgi:hypothetical protein